MKRTKTFTYNGATVTVRRATVRDRLVADTILWALPPDDTTAGRHQRRVYANIVTVSTVEGDLGFTLPAPDATDEALVAGFEALMDADGTLWDLWYLALATVNDLIADPELASPDPKDGATSGA